MTKHPFRIHFRFTFLAWKYSI